LFHGSLLRKKYNRFVRDLLCRQRFFSSVEAVYQGTYISKMAAIQKPVDAVPSGTVTFLFTDIQGSTRLWESHPQAMKTALARHDEVMGYHIRSHGGYVFKTVGDAFCAAFSSAVSAIEAAAAIQLALRQESWPEGIEILVRMGMHSGQAELRDGDYFGTPVNKAARIESAGHGGQVLLSSATAELIREGLTGRLFLTGHGRSPPERPA
jgi:class 3 adenylate cyclase